MGLTREQRQSREEVKERVIQEVLGDLVLPSHEVVFKLCIRRLRELGIYSKNTIDIDIRSSLARTYRRMQREKISPQ